MEMDTVPRVEPVGDDVLRVAAHLELDDALKELESLHPRGSKIVELRFYGGLSIPEAASVLEISERTVQREWRLARAWLRQQLGGDEPCWIPSASSG